MKKVLAVFLSSILMLSLLCTPAFAAETRVSAVNETEVADGFVATCDLVFSGKGEVFNSEGIEITQSFVYACREAYNMRNYAAILEACYDMEVFRICAHGNTETKASTRAYMTLSYEEYAIHFITQEGFPYDGKSWYFMVTATGTYVYLDGYDTIQAVHEPTIDVSYIDLGAAFAGSLDSVSVSTPVISADRSYATFNVTTEHTVGCPIPGVDFIMGTLGPFTNVSYFTIDP